MTSKALIFDSSAIITLALNNMLGILKPLKEAFGGKMLITSDIKKEIVDNPANVKRFELESLLISNLIKQGVLEVSFHKDLEKEKLNILKVANSLFSANNEKIRIVHDGEASCFALANLLSREYEVMLAIDERTSRILCEKSENLRRLFEKKFHVPVKIDRQKSGECQHFKIIRSAELLFVAYKKGFIDLPVDKVKAIDALLYASKFKGCSISFEEIEEAKRLI